MILLYIKYVLIVLGIFMVLLIVFYLYMACTSDEENDNGR